MTQIAFLTFLRQMQNLLKTRDENQELSFIIFSIIKYFMQSTITSRKKKHYDKERRKYLHGK